MSMFVKKITLEPNQIYKLKYEYHGDWFYKNGNVKKVDGPNMDKMLIDVISEKLQHDDCFLWDWHGKKVQNIEKEGVLCELTLIQGITNGRDAEKSSEGNTDGSEKNYGASWS